MGCCTQFRKTWWPGTDADVIDPNKTFDHQRRVRIIRKISTVSLVILILAGLTYLLIFLLTGGNNSDCKQNVTTTTQGPELPMSIISNLTEDQPETQALNQASILSTIFDSRNQDSSEGTNATDATNATDVTNVTDATNATNTTSSEHDEKSEEVQIIDGILESNSSNVVKEDVATILQESDIALVSFPNETKTNFQDDTVYSSDNTTERIEMMAGATVESPHLPNNSSTSTSELINHTTTEAPVLNQPRISGGSHNNQTQTSFLTPSNGNETASDRQQKHITNSSDPESFCSSRKNAVECVALSKDFRSITTFLPERKHSRAVEGYVMVKMQNATWHPYCHPHWTLDMGYKLCKGLGFQKLLQLQTIDISQLKQRISKLRKQVSLHFDHENQPTAAHRISTQPHELLVLRGSRAYSHENVPDVKLSTSDTNNFKCQVGFISCN